MPHATQGGTVDVGAAARMVLTDWNDGRIPYFAEPPQRAADDHAAAAIVAGWSAEFEADQVRSDERPLPHNICLHRSLIAPKLDDGLPTPKHVSSMFAVNVWFRVPA